MEHFFCFTVGRVPGEKHETQLCLFQELKELAALAYRDTTAENREFWKNELGQAIRDIQQEYDAKVEQLRGDMEGFYNLKVSVFDYFFEYLLDCLFIFIDCLFV